MRVCIRFLGHSGVRCDGWALQAEVQEAADFVHDRGRDPSSPGKGRGAEEAETSLAEYPEPQGKERPVAALPNIMLQNRTRENRESQTSSIPLT